MGKRKRDTSALKSRKSPKLDRDPQQATRSHQHSLLETYYPKICSLQEFLLSKLPASSRLRRKRITHFGVENPNHASFLTDVVVGILQEPSAVVQQTRRQELITFTQTQTAHLGRSGKLHRCNIEEVTGFVIWKLFQREPVSRRPDHILCHGYQRCDTVRIEDRSQHLILPGIVRQTPNANVDALLSSPWISLFNLLGMDSDMIVASLLLDCGIFQKLESGDGNLYQLSGKPVFRLTRTSSIQKDRSKASQTQSPKTDVKEQTISSPGSIMMVRNRMFYARPSINARGNVALGLKHIHVLNRYDRLDDQHHDLQIMRYIFPRQFGLHNVFTSKVDRSETVQPRMDYTIREHEIEELERKGRKRIPPRLRTFIMPLIRDIRRNHKCCSYSQLLRYYCPAQTTALTQEDLPSWTSSTSLDQSTCPVTQLNISRACDSVLVNPPFPSDTSSSYLPFTTPIHQVSAFCQRVLCHILPRNTFGKGHEGNANRSRLMSKVDAFIRMRRYETLSLHEISQDMKLKCISWLRPSGADMENNLSASDTTKRVELIQEFLYFLFDSMVIPLIRSNFYVTESGVHRNRLLYFRHDIWRRLSEPSLMTLRIGTFKPLNSRQLRHAFESNKLGYSQVRLLPKESGSRPITNLKRKPMRIINGKRVLGQSINAQLRPVFSVLNLEYQRDPDKLASALFSLGDIRDKLKSFQASLNDIPPGKLYFIKVDINSCFDTIPQTELLALIDTIVVEREYQTSSHVEVKQLAGFRDASNAQLVTKFKPNARVVGSGATFSMAMANTHAMHKRRTVFIGNEQERTWRLQQIQRLLREHIQQNIVKIGRRHFRQVAGIPQGSVLSSLLCNFFYADFEHVHLGFLDSRSSLLLRLVDDFLLITVEKEQAKAFARVMTHGDVKYGITTNPDKSLANFEVTVSGRQIPRIHGAQQFPYCGLGIDMMTLELSKDRQPRDKYMENALTVMAQGNAGKMFQRKIVSALKLQLQAMFLDDRLNHRLRIIATLFESFIETAMKMHRYRTNMPKRKRPVTIVMISVCRQLVALANRIVRREQHEDRAIVTPTQINWIASTAMASVLSKKQSEYRGVLAWMLKLQASTQNSMGMDIDGLDDIVRNARAKFQGYVY